MALVMVVEIVSQDFHRNHLVEAARTARGLGNRSKYVRILAGGGSAGMPAAPTQLDVVTMGRISVDLYPEQIGVSLADVRTFNKSLGGSASNVAVGAARLGRQSAVITRVGADGFGEYLRKALEGFGVYAGWGGTHPSLRTPLALFEILPPDPLPLPLHPEAQ